MTTATSRDLVIRHPSELNALRSISLYRPRGRGPVRLDPQLTHPDRSRWEERLNRHYYACGCDTGAKALVVGLLIFGSGAAVAWSTGRLAGVEAWWLGLSGAIITSGLGKAYGLGRARRHLRTVVAEIQAAWKPETVASSPRQRCG